ncbi:uncharacterized protein LOC118310409, partial [Scophthalmus maximus]|uniref:uncharacterized protein LOC118310409 n=1 Tax=Scophthalmus maximus TaxID=52904 RepID=UPI001FA8BCEB
SGLGLGGLLLRSVDSCGSVLKTLVGSQVFVLRLKHCDAFVFGNAIKLSVSPADPLPVQPSLFILSPLLPEGPGGPGGPGGRGGRDVCLAAGFRPQEGEMVLNLADRSVPRSTSSAALFRRDQTFFFAGFSNETIRSCDLLNTTARNQQIPSSVDSSDDSQPVDSSDDSQPVDSSDDSQPENVRLNSYLLLLNAARVVFTKTVAFSTVLTVRALLPSGPHHDHDH